MGPGRAGNVPGTDNLDYPHPHLPPGGGCPLHFGSLTFYADDSLLLVDGLLNMEMCT